MQGMSAVDFSGPQSAHPNWPPAIRLAASGAPRGTRFRWFPTGDVLDRRSRLRPIYSAKYEELGTYLQPSDTRISSDASVIAASGHLVASIIEGPSTERTMHSRTPNGIEQNVILPTGA